MISVLIPTRKRLTGLQRTVHSIRETATNPVEVVCYCDEDDPESAAFCEVLGVKCVVGPRITLSACWDKCLPLATGDIFQQGNDDVEYQTPRWDALVEEAFAAHPDKILLVHGNDGSHRGEEFGPHPFLHRKWVETVGYFIPGYFSSDYGDLWVHTLATELNRRKYLPFIIEHLHPGFGKAPFDQTHRDRLERHKTDHVEKTWEDTLPQRLADIEKLRAMMTT